MARARSNAVLNGGLGTLYALGAVGSLTDSGLLDRFLARGNAVESDAAFAALVERHGPMVLGVCRQALPCSHDAHDAFQATFLVLVRRAQSIRGRGSVAGWLFGIARRVAARARVEAARRQHHLEKLHQQHRSLRDDTPPDFSGEPEVDYGPLFEAIDALPERFRAPVLLHYFEGLSTSAISLRLGCAPGTVLSRLARARRRLRARLERRGVSLAGALPVFGGACRSILAPIVPASLVQATVRSGSCTAMAGAAVESLVPAMVAGLSRRVLRSAMLAEIGMASAFFLLLSSGAVIALVTGARALGGSQHPAANDVNVAAPAGPATAAPAKTVPRAEENGLIVIRGRVVGPDGKPVKDAQIVLSRPKLGAGEIRSCDPLARSGPDGRFEASVPRALLEQLDQLAVGQIEPTSGPVVGAIAPGLAIDWVKADVPSVEKGELTIALGPDDAAIEGQIISSDGRPVAGVLVRLISVVAVKLEFLARLHADDGKLSRDMRDFMRDGIPLGERGAILPAKTDSSGRFRMGRVGRDRLALLFIEHEGFERTEALVFTTTDSSFQKASLPVDGSAAQRVLGPSFTMRVAPGRAVEGVVRDADTRQPIAGARAVLYGIGLTASADAHGHFRINGQPWNRPGWPNLVGADVPGQPYIKLVQAIDDGFRTLRIDAETGRPVTATILTEIALKRGAWVEGRVVDRATGKPVQATIEYCPFADNPHLQEYAGASFLDDNGGDEAEFATDEQGRFRAVALPGGGVLGVRTADPSFGSGEARAPQLASRLPTVSSLRQSDRYQAILPIEVNDRETLVVPEIKLARVRPRQRLTRDKD
jgi:RNA polymerase sigma factor (sigma-70 family)